MKKINQYVFIQIFKSCTLVFFIFVSIAWLLQISRLFSYLSNFQVKFLDILNLSIFLIPNLINVILPFIVIFGIIIAFIKLDKDKEIIGIFSLGLSIEEIRKPIIFFSIIISIIYISFNYFLSPVVYDIYKKKEFELRNLINFDKINIANFIEVDENTVIDFIKEGDKFKDIFINFNDEYENQIYAESAILADNENKIVFNLFNGFKLSFKDSNIEKLKFDTYKFTFPNKKNNYYSNLDKNTITFYKSIKNKDYKIIFEKIVDILLILTIILFFYYLNVKDNDYQFKRILIFLIITITIIIIHNITKNIDLTINRTLIIMLFNLFIPYFYIIFIKNKFI